MLYQVLRLRHMQICYSSRKPLLNKANQASRAVHGEERARGHTEQNTQSPSTANLRLLLPISLRNRCRLLLPVMTRCTCACFARDTALDSFVGSRTAGSMAASPSRAEPNLFEYSAQAFQALAALATKEKPRPWERRSLSAGISRNHIHSHPGLAWAIGSLLQWRWSGEVCHSKRSIMHQCTL